MIGKHCKSCPNGTANRTCRELDYIARFVPPDQWLEGDPESRVWIIGLNPRSPKAEREAAFRTLTTQRLRQALESDRSRHPYFKDFARVSKTLFDLLGVAGGVAHTDIVKCHSHSWPPPGLSAREANAIEAACGRYLQDQLKLYRPRVLICNGASVGAYISNLLRSEQASDDDATWFKSDALGFHVAVVLTGFIGRLDNYSRRRLGREIESVCLEMGIALA